MFGIVLEQIIFLAVILAVGFISVKIKWVPEELIAMLPKLMLNVLLPFLIISSIVNSGTREEVIAVWPFIFVILFMFVIGLIIGVITGKMLKLEQPVLSTHICSATYLNSVLVGLPILDAVFPEMSGIYLAAYLIVETVMTWVVAVAILSSASTGKVNINLKKMLTPSTVALVIALVMKFVDFQPSGIVWEALRGIGSTQKYLGLMYIGMDVARRGFKKLFEKPKVFFVAPIKLIIMPMVFFFIVKATGFISDEMLLAATIFAMLPTMMVVTVLASEYDAAPEYAVASLLVTTVGCLFTMPFVLPFLSNFCTL